MATHSGVARTTDVVSSPALVAEFCARWGVTAIEDDGDPTRVGFLCPDGDGFPAGLAPLRAEGYVAIGLECGHERFRDVGASPGP